MRADRFARSARPRSPPSSCSVIHSTTWADGGLSCTLRASRTRRAQQFGPPSGEALSHLLDLLGSQAVSRELGVRIDVDDCEHVGENSKIEAGVSAGGEFLQPALVNLPLVEPRATPAATRGQESCPASPGNGFQGTLGTQESQEDRKSETPKVRGVGFWVLAGLWLTSPAAVSSAGQLPR
jgi:hypothetical protein